VRFRRCAGEESGAFRGWVAGDSRGVGEKLLGWNNMELGSLMQ